MSKLEVNAARLEEDLDSAWEVLAEPIQSVMRRYGLPEPYERLKELTRGQGFSKQKLASFLEGMSLNECAIHGLGLLRPDSYVGLARELALKELVHG
jgi:adenylosuccinate lyase